MASDDVEMFNTAALKAVAKALDRLAAVLEERLPKPVETAHAPTPKPRRRARRDGPQVR